MEVPFQRTDARGELALAAEYSPVGGLHRVLRYRPDNARASTVLVSRAAAAAIVACLGFVSGRAQTAPAPGQHTDHSTPPAAFNGRIGLYKSALGPFTRPISSQNREAQAFFNQGFQLTYAFAKPEAVRSFREAEMRDPIARSATGARPGRGDRI